MRNRSVLPFLCLTLALTGCSALAEETEGVEVATAFYPLQYVAERVGGELVTVENLTQVGKEPHDLELTIRETALIAQADLVIHEGGFQASVDDGVAQNATGEVLDVTDVVDLVPFDDDHGDAEEDHEDHEGHDHGDLDPHFWQDPARLAEVGDAVAEDLAVIDPDHADDYRAQARDLREDLEALDTEYAEGLAGCARDTIVVSHDAFGYLGKYGLHLAPIAGLSPEAEPTVAGLADLQSLIEEEGITTVFSETLASPRFARPLADDLGIDTDVLDPLEGLTSDNAGDDYVSIMRDNLAALRKANGCR